jgi:hypothetical protein
MLRLDENPRLPCVRMRRLQSTSVPGGRLRLHAKICRRRSMTEHFPLRPQAADRTGAGSGLHRLPNRTCRVRAQAVISIRAHYRRAGRHHHEEDRPRVRQ